MDKHENEKSPETGETTEVVVNIIRFILNLGVGAIGLVCVFFGFLYFALTYEHRFNLPYNAIDFQKIAYIDNQFVMYGVDFDAKYDKQLVIFTSLDGKKWDKAVIAKVKPETKSDADSYYNISNLGTFAYFNHQCMLIGAVPKVLVSPDCHNWSYLETKQENGNPTPFWNAHASVVANNRLYITTEQGIFTSLNGVVWQKEFIPNAAESRYQLSGFYSIASGNNKVITETEIRMNNNREGLIYTKDLTTNKWSYEIYPLPVGSLTRGNDRFVGTSGSYAFVLTDTDNGWESIILTTKSYDVRHGFGAPHGLSYGVSNKFVGVNRLLTSNDGINWVKTYPSGSKDIWALNVACSDNLCIGIGNEYQLITTNDGFNWHYVDFGYKNPKPHWWRRFF